MLEELDIKDPQGNIVIQPGLKVRHKSSQYEYTVDDVVEDRDGEITVLLRMPEEPRFDPPPEEEVVISDSKSLHNRLYEVNPSSLDYFVTDEKIDSSHSHAGEEEFLAVPQNEFEKDYEVR